MTNTELKGELPSLMNPTFREKAVLPPKNKQKFAAKVTQSMKITGLEITSVLQYTLNCFYYQANFKSNNSLKFA